MEIKHESFGEAAIVVPVGRVDSATAKAFEAQLLQVVHGAAVRIVVDFSELDYISSAGLRVVLVGAKMTRSPRKFALCGMKPHIREIFDVSGFAKILSILPDRESAASV